MDTTGNVTVQTSVQTPDVRSTVSAVSTAANTTLPCSHCCYMQKRYEYVKRANVHLHARYKAALRKIRSMSKRNVGFNVAVSKFLRRDQVNALSRNSRRGVKWSSPTVKSGLALHFTCSPTGYV